MLIFASELTGISEDSLMESMLDNKKQKEETKWKKLTLTN